MRCFCVSRYSLQLRVLSFFSLFSFSRFKALREPSIKVGAPLSFTPTAASIKSASSSIVSSVDTSARTTEVGAGGTIQPRESVRVRSPYDAPELRIRGKLAAITHSSLSPEQVAGSRIPHLLKDWSSAPIKRNAREGRTGSTAASSKDIDSSEELWSAAGLSTAFDGGGWALRGVRAQWSTPVFKLSDGRGAKSARIEVRRTRLF